MLASARRHEKSHEGEGRVKHNKNGKREIPHSCSFLEREGARDPRIALGHIGWNPERENARTGHNEKIVIAEKQYYQKKPHCTSTKQIQRREEFCESLFGAKQKLSARLIQAFGNIMGNTGREKTTNGRPRKRKGNNLNDNF